MQDKLPVKFTDLPGLKFYKRGKVREIYSVEDNYLMVATDRILETVCWDSSCSFWISSAEPVPCQNFIREPGENSYNKQIRNGFDGACAWRYYCRLFSSL